ncbi:hypothetical protein ACFV97_05585 [Streptomyces sp. NPDC059913]|uniref:hypothetical protein n=1 Tax=unclassified Streptomyces TaxID=2593676 RepID=UPI00364A7272
MTRPLAETALEALEDGPPAATAGPGGIVEPVVADVWTGHAIGCVLILHRRDDGLVAEELFHSVRGPGGWAGCDHLSGGLLGFDPRDVASREAVLAGRGLAVVTESESLVHTGRSAEDEGDELLRFVELLVAAEADVLDVENLTEPSRGHRPVPSDLALLVLFPGDRLRVRAARSTPAGNVPVGEAVELSQPPRPSDAATVGGWW